MSIACLNIINDLNKSVDKANFELVNNMTQSSMKYEWVCIRPDATYDFYYKYLKKEWEQLINDFINQPNKCPTRLSQLIELYNFLTPDKVAKVREIINTLTTQETDENVTGLNSINLDNIVLDIVATSLMSPWEDNLFELQQNFFESMTSLGRTLAENCNCQVVDIFKTFIKKYKRKYQIKFIGKTKDEVIDMLRDDYNKFKELLKNLKMSNTSGIQLNFKEEIVNKFTGIYGFTVEKELDKLIPNELGSLKDFFIVVISKYYDNLHPIIWAQIFKNISENIFVDLPFTSNEIFQFVSKYSLLNSGPFILKILQLIRPVLSPELAAKYNLTKLTYPLLKPNEVELILSRVVYDWEMYIILENFSASVGHVCKVIRADNPSYPFIIKIIKPLAVAQSCWEYKTLYNTFPEGTCEQAFIKRMLESNGKELNVNNEIKNVNRGHDLYTANYSEIYSVDIDAKLTTINNIPGIIKQGTWNALALTYAPGIPISKLVEEDIINRDTKYRAKLHRCLDLLVYKFFHNIVTNGFYHGDLHAGNIFFSFVNKQITLIDFGSVGEINLYDNNTDTNTLLDIIVMSMFYNFDEMFDVMTVLLNSKCTDSIIDMNSSEYQQLKQTLYEYHIRNIKNQEKEKQKEEIYKNDIFSEKRIKEETENENKYIEQYKQLDPKNIDSIYAYLEYKPRDKETIVENRDELPPFTQIGDKTDSISFNSVLEQIIKFYAISGVNIAIKFSEFYEFQKAYALIMGVLHKVGYNPYRISIAIRKAIINWRNIPQLINLPTVIHVTKKYWEEHNKFNELKTKLNLPIEQISNDFISSSNTSNITQSNSMTDTLNIQNKYNNISIENYLSNNTLLNDITLSNKKIDDEIMIGGNNFTNSYRKYLKYKTKYYKLRLTN